MNTPNAPESIREGAVTATPDGITLSKRKPAEAAVHAEQKRFRDALDQLPAYLVLLAPDYHLRFVNRFFEERFGKSNGKRCYEYLFNFTEPCENCQTYNVLKTNAPQRWEWTGPDGRNYDIHDFPFTDVDGSPLIMEVEIDITERKQAKAEIRRRAEELRERNEELMRFNEVMVGRELRMIELKEEINALCAQVGQPPRYGAEADEQARPPKS